MKTPWYRRIFQKAEPPQVALFPHLPPHLRQCPRCKVEVSIWRTYASSLILCVDCATKQERKK